MPKKPAPPPVDLDALARDYRTGYFTDRELGTKYGRSHTWIQKTAKAKEWQRDLARAVDMATQAKLAEMEVTKSDGPDVAKVVRRQIEAALPATVEVVAALAEINTQVVARHRAELRTARNEVMALWGELRTAAELGAALPGRIAAAGVLVTALAKLHDNERVAYGLTDNDLNPRDERKSLPIVFVDAPPRPKDE